tara:strand:- start:497 stop:2227 length:1731 start_codon:yes stop_codon:yes gene_type:complete
VVTPFRIAQAQINCTVGDLAGNTEKICHWIQRARALNADLISFPELAITGYPPEDLLLKPQFVADNIDALQVVADEAKGIVVVVGFVDKANGLYNAAAILSQGKILGAYHKHCLPNYGVFDEKRYFRSGRRQHIIVVNGVSVGLSICEDMWTPRGPTRIQASAGATVIISINASPYQIGKVDERERMLRTRAMRNLVIVAFNNLVGGQDELVFDGCSMVVDHEGRLLAKGKAFEEDLVVVDLDIQKVLESRKQEQARSYKLSARTQSVTRIVCSGKPYTGKRVKVSPALGKTLTTLEEIYQALCLGIRDYVHKNGFSKVAIGLSGGVDSALTASLAVDALGSCHVLGVFMPSRHTSHASRVDVESLVRNLGIDLQTISIEKAYTAILDMLADAFQGTNIDTTEENLQARIRGNVLMALSNKFGWLVLSTGNKSEMSVGYVTLYGDMAGGLSVLKDVPKTMVYNLARFRNAIAPSAMIPEHTLHRAPTAELRAGQTDQDVLPPYDVLDQILESYVEGNHAVDEIAAMGFGTSTVEQVGRMVDGCEYKRRQAPVGIKITSRALGKDRRMPVTNRYRET